VSESVLAWLAAWRAGHQPLTQRKEPAAPAPAPAVAVVPAQQAPATTPPKVNPMSNGFTEPRPWECDGCARPAIEPDAGAKAPTDGIGIGIASK
jgi:hypothetical protein